MPTARIQAGFVLRLLMPLLGALLVAGCGGGGSGGASGGGAGTNVTISGKITFDRVPFKAKPLTGLNFSGIIESPARNVVVEAVQPGNVLGGETIVASTTTDAAGDYSLQVPANTTVFIRAKAQMLKTVAAPTWNFKVLNNTNGDALYVMDGTAASSGGASSTRSLRATSGWGGTGYTGTRAAAPFAILDSIYQVKALILSARADTAFPALDLFWSVSNRPASPFCPDIGNIVSSLYTTFGASSPNDECSTPTAGKDGIYVLGDFTQGDTDEFDQHVIAHEAGHYFEDRFARSDSIGGEHSLSDRLDLRVAFGEGWGDAFGAMALNDPVYRDSQLGASQEFGFNLESDVPSVPGWFSEFSTLKILWDLFDGANEPNDTVALGFTPIYNVMTSAQSSTDSLTGIFPFVRALKAGNAASVAGINALLAEHTIVSSVDDFGSTETNNGGSADALPVYSDIQLGVPQQVCGNASLALGFYNKLGNRRFLRLVLTQQTTVSITATGLAGVVASPAPDPDILVWRRGQVVAFANGVGAQEVLPLAGQSPLSLAAGTYVIEVFEYSHTDAAEPQRGRTCINVSVTG